MELPKDNQPENKDRLEDGLDEWNKRLDENLEPEDKNDIAADANAKKFSDKNNKVKDSDS